ncbi:TPA: site-specific DNA-methyltransferase [Clostridium perfringens]|nr:site-specific DNA-methyltransferase [Clostridium perfringens]
MLNLSNKKRKEMIDFLEILRQEHTDDKSIRAINQIENELTEKKYGLVWEEYSEKVDEMLVNNIPIFKEIEDKKILVNEEKPFNFLLEGDNLHSLTLLEKTHTGKVDVIYIDPPYNTGNKDFIYDDKFIDKTDGYIHSKWLSFMSKRLEIARKLLKDEGIIFISIDDNEQAQLKLLCDEIFGEENFQSTIHTQVRYSEKSLTEEKSFKPVIEYVLVYSKNYHKFNPKREKEEYTDENFHYKITELKEGKEFFVGSQKVTVFKKGEWKLEDLKKGSKTGLKETWISGTIYTKMSYGQVFQSIVEPRVESDGLGCLYKVHGRGEDGLGYRYYTGPQRKNAKRGKMYSGIPLSRINEMENDGASFRMRPIKTFYDYAADFGNITHEGKVTFNSGKKPTKMLKMLINLCDNENATVLDFFAGSGSTGHAVEQLNVDTGGNRKYILCTNNENNICEEITYKRLKNIQDDLPHNLKYYRTEFIPKVSIDDDISIKQIMTDNTVPLIELEYGVEIDNIHNIIITDEEKVKGILQKAKNNINIFITSDIMLSQEEKALAAQKSIKIIEIPEYYFRSELREVGEI